VAVAGAFNDWKPAALTLDKQGVWSHTTTPLEEGTYTYKFIVDGKWRPDELSPARSKTPSGEESLFDIGAGDHYAEPGPCAARKTYADNGGLVAVTLNTHSLQETTGRFGKLRAIAAGLARLNTDIAGLNEIVFGNIFSGGYAGRYYDTAEIIRSHLECLSGRPYYLYREGFGRWENGEWLGSAILSAHPLAATDTVKLTTTDFWPAPASQRNCLYAKISLPSGAHADVFVTHLMGYDYPDTAIQIGELKRFVDTRRSTGAASALVMGDFNVPSTHDNYRVLLESGPVFTDLFAAADAGGKDTPTTTGGQRIDYIFWVDGAWRLRERRLRSSVIFDGQEHWGYRYPVVSDHFGVAVLLGPPRKGTHLKK
jgi:endonuclease/exonuclease/phosphatase family metal-dependent hydrolase